MKVIKIIRESINHNPRAGQTSTEVLGEWTGNFTVTAVGSESINFIIDKLKLIPGIVFTSWSDNLVEGLAEFPEALLKLNYQGQFYEDFKVEIFSNQNYEHVQHPPLPKYLYEYENPCLECNQCHSQIRLSDIEYDYSEDGDKVNVCPKCYQFDTFEEFIYENINNLKLD